MFNCGFCKKTSEPGEKKTMVPVETREKVYTGTTYDGRTYEQGRGTEIVRELAACPKCVTEKR